MSDRELRFSIAFPKHPKYEPFRGSFEDGERHCLERLRVTGSVDALNYLIDHYRLHAREDLARRKLEELVADTANLEARAIAYVYLGWSYERTGDWEMAIDAYRGALALEPSDGWTAYFTHNNLGRCLCEVASYAEAERHCRQAIALDPARPDGHRSLGQSLHGQGDLGGAARAWVEATRANAADGRALNLLERLIQARPQLLDEQPRLRISREECRRAVALAREMYEQTRSTKDRAASSKGCRACGEQAVEMEVFGEPIDEKGRRRAVMICPSCGKQSLATCLQFDVDRAEASEPEAAPEAPSLDPEPAEPPRLGTVLYDLFLLSMLGLTIAHVSGFLGLAASGPDRRTEVGDVWLMGLRAIIALGLTTAVQPVREAAHRVWRAFRWWWQARRREAGWDPIQ